VLSDGDIRKLVDKTFREEAKRLGVSILSLEIKPDHVQVRAELPPHLAPLKFITRLKAESSHAVYEKFPNLKEGIALKVR
jgi:REP element-mobilizing transposase RayT